MLTGLLNHNSTSERPTRPLATDIGIAAAILAVLLALPASLAAAAGFLWGGIPEAITVYTSTTAGLLSDSGVFGTPQVVAAVYGAAVTRVIPFRRGVVLAFLLHSKLAILALSSESFLGLTGWWFIEPYVFVGAISVALHARRWRARR